MAHCHSLRLPASAAAALDQSTESNQDLAKWLIYICNSTSASAEKVRYEAMKAYNENTLHEPETEWDEMGFVKPANEAVADVQTSLDKHVALIQRLLNSKVPDVWNSNRLYPAGFVVIDDDDWSEKGVIVIHCDKDDERGEWKVLQRRFKVKDLGFALTTVLDGDDSFEQVAEEYGIDCS